MSDLDEWRYESSRLTETERLHNQDAHRAAIGLVGEATDDMYGGDW